MSGFDHDLAIIGGGPAGLAAAATARAHVLETILFDEQPAPGGQIYRNVEGVSRDAPGLLPLLGEDYGRGRALAEAFRGSGAAYAPETSVWEIEPDGTLGVLGPSGAALVRARRILIAAGAMERPMPVPGWTLPGVMTVGAAQSLLKSAGAVPDVPVVMAGSGPLLYLVAHQLIASGAPLRAVLDTTPPGNYRRALAHLPAALRSAGQLLTGRRWMREIRAKGISLVRGARDVRAAGGDRLEAVEFSAGGENRRLDAGLLLLHQGVVPNHHLALSVDCAAGWDDTQFCWRTETDTWGATSVDTIAVAGDCGGIGGALAAEHQGRLAALDAAHRLDALDRPSRDRQAAPGFAAIRRVAGLRRFLDVLFRPAPEYLVPPRDDVVVCRCEEVTAGELRQVVGHGCMGPNQAKAFTRAGMGPCQGRMCGLCVSAVIADARRVPVAEVGHYRVRPPLKPLTVGQLADLEGVGREVAALTPLPTGPGEAESKGAADR